MASDKDFVSYVVDQMKSAGRITSRKMFGEYALYCDGKVVALICDNQVFVKQTTAGRALICSVVERPPYPGAKNYFLIDELDNSVWLSDLIRATAGELPVPYKKQAGTVNNRTRK